MLRPNWKVSAFPVGAAPRQVIEPIAYADLYSFPLTQDEVRTFCVAPLSSEEVGWLLRCHPEVRAVVEEENGYYFLRGRRSLISLRQFRAQKAERLWRQARRIAWVFSHLPFVRALAVTGSLAVDNPGLGADIDLLLIAERGRLWTVHAMVRLFEKTLWRHALCVNYYLTTEDLTAPERNLFGAREIIQAQPLIGLACFWDFLHANDWVRRFFPNWQGPLPERPAEMPRAWPWTKLAEACLQGPWGERLEALLQRVIVRRIKGNLGLTDQTLAPAGITITPVSLKIHMGHHQRVAEQVYSEIE